MTNPLRITRLAFQESTTSLTVEEMASFLRATAKLFVFVTACVLVMELSIAPVHAATLIWTNSNGDFGTAANWDPAQAPAGGDSTMFTNDTIYTVNLAADSPALVSSTISNHAGVVTFNPNGFTWRVTNDFRVGVAGPTTTLYVAGGTLAVAGIGATNGQLRIGDASSPFNCVATMIVTNGTVAADAGIIGASATAVGTLIITGNGVYRDGGTGSGSTLTVGSASAGNRLIVTNGGKLFVDGTLTVGNNLANSNNFMLISGPTSAATITTAGQVQFRGASGRLIVSNAAKLFMTGSLLFGVSSSANTGIVVGAGSAVIAQGSFQVGVGSSGGTNNYFLVYDGGFISSDGTFAFGNAAFHINEGIQIGGTGLMSTGVFTVVRSVSNNTNHFGNFMTVTNASVAAEYLNPQGPGETVSILAKGTWKVTNSVAISVPAASSNSISMNGVTSTLLIDGGTMDNLRTPDNVGGINFGGAGGNSLIITNGGKLLSDAGTLGAATSFTTGVVVGASSVWSNGTRGVLIGTGAFAGNNFLEVADGGTFYNAGSLNIGNSPTSSLNAVKIGGPGGTVTFTVGDTLRVGSSSGADYNKLTITNNAVLNSGTIIVGANAGTINTSGTNNLFEIRGGTVNVNFLQVRGSNSILFTAGTLKTGHTTVNDGANGGKPTVVGDGTSPASFIMVAGGDGSNDFSSGGLVITNNGILSGNGTLSGTVTVLGTLAPGLSVGTNVTTSHLVLGPAATLNFDLGTNNSDFVNVQGSLTLDGTLNITASPGGFGVGNYTLFTYAGALTDNGLNIGANPNGSLTYTIDKSTTNFIVLQVTGGAGDPYTTWASGYGLTGGSALGTADPDGDGMNNTNEFLARFNPNNNAAYVHVISVAKASITNIVVTYLGANGDSTANPASGSRTNVLEFTLGTGNGSYTSTNFVSTGQTNILSGGTGLGTVTSFVDTNGASGTTKYYRVRVLVP